MGRSLGFEPAGEGFERRIFVVQATFPRTGGAFFPQQRLNFSREPQGQGADLGVCGAGLQFESPMRRASPVPMKMFRIEPGSPEQAETPIHNSKPMVRDDFQPFGNMLILLVECCIFIRTQSTATGSDGAVQFEANPEAWSDLQFEPNPRRVRWPAGWRIARQAARHAKKPCNSNPIAVARSGGDTIRSQFAGEDWVRCVLQFEPSREAWPDLQFEPNWRGA